MLYCKVLAIKEAIKFIQDVKITINTYGGMKIEGFRIRGGGGCAS